MVHTFTLRLQTPVPQKTYEARRASCTNRLLCLAASFVNLLSVPGVKKSSESGVEIEKAHQLCQSGIRCEHRQPIPHLSVLLNRLHPYDFACICNHAMFQHKLSRKTDPNRGDMHFAQSSKQPYAWQSCEGIMHVHCFGCLVGPDICCWFNCQNHRCSRCSVTQLPTTTATTTSQSSLNAQRTSNPPCSGVVLFLAAAWRPTTPQGLALPTPTSLHRH